MRRKMKTILLLVAVLIFCMSGCKAGEFARNDQGQIILKFASNIKQNEIEQGNPAGLALMEFINKTEEYSENRIKIQLYTDGQLASKNEEIIAGLKTGAFDITNLSTGSWGEFTDAYMPLNIPYLFINEDVVDKAIDGFLGDSMKEEVLNDTGLKILSLLNIGYRHTTNSKHPIHTPNDMKGIKIRTQTDPYQIRAMESLGAAVTPIAYSELFTSLQQGLIDGQENPLANIYSAKLYEVQKFLTLTGHNYTWTTIAINQNRFDTLSEEDKEALIKAAKDAELVSREGVRASDAKTLEALSEFLEVYTPTFEELEMFRDQTMPVWEDIKKAIGEEYYENILREINEIESELGLK